MVKSSGGLIGHFEYSNSRQANPWVRYVLFVIFLFLKSAFLFFRLVSDFTPQVSQPSDPLRCIMQQQFRCSFYHVDMDNNQFKLSNKVLSLSYIIIFDNVHTDNYNDSRKRDQSLS